MTGTIVLKRMLPAVTLALLACAAAGQDAPEGARATDEGWLAPPGARLRSSGWFPARVAKERPELPEEVTRAFVIPVRGDIDDRMHATIVRKAAQCIAKGAELIIFDMDTRGGPLDAMENIAHLILDDLRSIYTVVYVNPKGFSAGAIVSLACDEVAMAPSGVIGDAMPILIGPQGIMALPPKVRIKFESGARGLARAIAARNGYNLDLCNGMITIDIELWLIRNETTGELRVIDADRPEWLGKVRSAPPRAERPKPTEPDRDAAPRNEPAKAAPGDPAADGDWTFLRRIDGPDELVTFTPDEAYQAGLIDHVFNSMDDLLAHYRVAGEPVVLEDTWSEILVAFLTSPAVMGFLFFLAVLFAYVEMHTPGFGAAGAIAIICMGLILGSGYLVGLAQWWEVLLIIVGLILIAVEIFLIPGFGVTGILGGVLVLVGTVGAIVPNAPDKWPVPTTDLGWSMFGDAAFALGVAFVAALVAMPILSRFLPRIPVVSRLVIGPAQAATDAPVSDASPMQGIRVGDTGVVIGMCRPVGKVRVGDEIVDAMTEGGIIEAGGRVRVMRREGNRLVVERVG